MKKYLLFLTFVIFYFVLYSCSPGLPSGYSIEEFHSLVLEGEGSISRIPDLSMLTERQRNELGDEISFGLAIALIDRGRAAEAEHLLSLLIRSGGTEWAGYAERLSNSILMENGKGLAESRTPQRFEELDRLDPEAMKSRAIGALSAKGQGGFSELIELFLNFPAGTIHKDVLNSFFAAGYFLNDLKPFEQDLVSAKLSLLEKEYSIAESFYKAALLYDYGGSTGILEDLVNIYRRTGRLRTGARFLVSAAHNPALKVGKWEVLLGAGRLYRWAGKYEDAGLVLAEALAITPGKAFERVLWYLQDCLLKASPEKGGEILSTYAPLWQDADYYSDSVEFLTSYIVRTGRWQILNDILPTVLEYGAPSVKAKILYISARLGEEGIYDVSVPTGIESRLAENGREGEPPWNDFLFEVIETAPNSYYAWLARVRLGIPCFDQESVSLSSQPGDVLFSSAVVEAGDPILSLLTGLQYYTLAFQWLEESYSGFPGDDRDAFLKLARNIQSRELWLDSIRLISRLPRSMDPSERSLEELFLYYPRPHREIIENAAEKYSLPPALIFGLVREESGFTPAIESWAGAVGLMQLMPSTAEDVAGRMKLEHWELQDPVSNVEMGSWYLDWLRGYVGELMPSILAYNGGPGRIRRYLKELDYLPADIFSEGLPMSETRNYGPKVLVSALYYGYLYYGISPEETIAEFFPEL
ncbi:MAG: lytic transglycosylase domain-containing protein [Spirochaetales bacterium]|nr:lytic transglycosylase domain-containing protein [Spirochaetales bacterium]